MFWKFYLIMFLLYQIWLVFFSFCKQFWLLLIDAPEISISWVVAIAFCKCRPCLLTIKLNLPWITKLIYLMKWHSKYFILIFFPDVEIDTFFPTRIGNKHTKSEGSSEMVLLELIPNASTIFKNKILCLNCFKLSFWDRWRVAVFWQF